MNSRGANVAMLLVALAIVAVSAYVIVDQGLAVYQHSKRQSPPLPAAPVAAPSEPTTVEALPRYEPAPVRPGMQREASQRVAAGIYRCEDQGRIIYADQPCMNGKAIAR